MLIKRFCVLSCRATGSKTLLHNTRKLFILLRYISNPSPQEVSSSTPRQPVYIKHIIMFSHFATTMLLSSHLCFSLIADQPHVELRMHYASCFSLSVMSRSRSSKGENGLGVPENASVAMWVQFHATRQRMLDSENYRDNAVAGMLISNDFIFDKQFKILYRVIF